MKSYIICESLSGKGFFVGLIKEKNKLVARKRLRKIGLKYFQLYDLDKLGHKKSKSVKNVA